VTLAAQLRSTWARQADVGFLLSDPATAAIEARSVEDPASGIAFELWWIPHRELRSDVDELKRRGIVNPDLDGQPLFHDPRQPDRFCFLCSDNIRVVNPLEELVPVRLAGRDYFAGANFAWIADHHYTVMAAEHIDQDFTSHVVPAMLDLHARTDGEFRVLYNASSAGATIPWHLHYQVTSKPLPVEALPPGGEPTYPTAIERFEGSGAADEAAATVARWLAADEHHRVNLLVAGPVSSPVIHVFARDTRFSHAPTKGLMGGFEVCGSLIYSEPAKRSVFETADAQGVRDALVAVRPPGA
jgi:hypothetical protein